MLSLSGKILRQCNRPILQTTMKAELSTTTTIRSQITDQKLQHQLEHQRLIEQRREVNIRFKAHLNTLPALDYPPTYQVDCISDLEEINNHVRELRAKEKVFGVDLEWPPTFIKGQTEKPVSLVQLCCSDKILLIQLARMKGGFPDELRKFFEDRDVLKSGVNIRADGLKLMRDFGIITNGLVELRDMAELTRSNKLCITHQRSLCALTGIFLDQNMSKGKVRLSDWSKSNLTSKQIKYAALDAYASYQLYVVLDELRDKSTNLNIRHLADEVSPSSSSSFKPKNTKKAVNRVEKKRNLDNNSTPTSTTTVIKRL